MWLLYESNFGVCESVRCPCKLFACLAGTRRSCLPTKAATFLFALHQSRQGSPTNRASLQLLVGAWQRRARTLSPPPPRTVEQSPQACPTDLSELHGPLPASQCIHRPDPSAATRKSSELNQDCTTNISWMPADNSGGAGPPRPMRRPQSAAA